MNTFPISEAREAGQHTRNLRKWANDIILTCDGRRKVVPLSREVREGWHESISCDMAAAFKARHECSLILRAMRKHPGFMEGFRNG